MSHEKIHYYDIKTINISLVCDYSIQQLWCYISIVDKKDVNQNVGFLEDLEAYNVPPIYLVIAWIFDLLETNLIDQSPRFLAPSNDLIVYFAVKIPMNNMVHMV